MLAVVNISSVLHPFNGPFSGTTQVSQYQKGKTNLDFTEARNSEWQWHQLGNIQVCTSLQTDNHASTPPLQVFYRPDALPAAQPTASKHWRLSTEGWHLINIQKRQKVLNCVSHLAGKRRKKLDVRSVPVIILSQATTSFMTYLFCLHLHQLKWFGSILSSHRNI